MKTTKTRNSRKLLLQMTIMWTHVDWQVQPVYYGSTVYLWAFLISNVKAMAKPVCQAMHHGGYNWSSFTPNVLHHVNWSTYGGYNLSSLSSSLMGHTRSLGRAEDQDRLVPSATGNIRRMLYDTLGSHGLHAPYCQMMGTSWMGLEFPWAWYEEVVSFLEEATRPLSYEQQKGSKSQKES